MQVPSGEFAWRGDGAGHSLVDSLRSRRAPGFFVVGFGTSRHLARPGKVAIPDDPVTHRVRGLFDSHHRMLGLQFGEALEAAGLQDAFLQLVNEAIACAETSEGRLLPELGTLHRTKRSGGDVVVDFGWGGAAGHACPLTCCRQAISPSSPSSQRS